MDQIKSNIVYFVYMFLDEKNIQDRDEAKEWLKKLARKYNMPALRDNKKLKIDLKVAFKQYLKNDKGMTETIPQLYNSL